ncbi:MAG: type II toxin-antitoxin system HicB family antitoxin [Candidatus Yanofskybacteria bacterium]|nr:type II toxin-antitoxin system HicB family antitoxin [Candidatus Yanofskybacteria bacterium]
MLNKKQFKVIIEQGESGYFIATVPALPGCHTQGKTMKELTKNIKDVIKLCLEEAKENPDYRKQISNFGTEPTFVGMEVVTL